MSHIMDAVKLHYIKVGNSHAIEDHARILMFLTQVGLFLALISVSDELSSEDKKTASRLLGDITLLIKDIR